MKIDPIAKLKDNQEIDKLGEPMAEWGDWQIISPKATLKQDKINKNNHFSVLEVTKAHNDPKVFTFVEQLDLDKHSGTLQLCDLELQQPPSLLA